MLEAEVDELQAELAAAQAVAAKHQRTAAASGQEIKVLQRLSSSGDISFMRTHSQTGRRSTTGHRYSEQGIPSFGSHDDLVHLQVRAFCPKPDSCALKQVVLKLHCYFFCRKVNMREGRHDFTEGKSCNLPLGTDLGSSAAVVSLKYMLLTSQQN